MNERLLLNPPLRNLRSRDRTNWRNVRSPDRDSYAARISIAARQETGFLRII
ncbi:hypothetical protein QUB68_08085 [Microcoleus sp. A006_D1]|uniref:hypothetical protein n=1 Tax=Microcoleus sp. A006_D1 TaxID=3055267 RepID=UPI002FD35EAC